MNGALQLDFLTCLAFTLLKDSQATLQELPDCGVSSSFVARERLELSTS